jgi:PQQ-like domain
MLRTTFTFLVVLLVFILTGCSKTVDPSIPNVSIVITKVDTTSGNVLTVFCQISNDGQAQVVTRGVCFNTSPDPDITNSFVVDSSGSANFSTQLTKLKPNTKYFIRAFVTTNKGTVYSSPYDAATYLDPNRPNAASLLFVGGGYSPKLFALKAIDGSTKWIATLGGTVLSSPVYENGFVFVICGDNQLYKFDTLGKLAWKVALTSGAYNEYQVPVIGNGKIYLTAASQTFCFNTIDGSLAWKGEPGAGGIIVSLRDNTIYAGGFSLVAYDAISGQKKWQILSRSVKPIIRGNNIFVLNTENPNQAFTLDARELATGQLVKRYVNVPVFQELVSFNIQLGNIYCTTQGVQANMNGAYGLNILDSTTGVKKVTINSLALIQDLYGPNPRFYREMPYLSGSYGFSQIDPYTGIERFSLPLHTYDIQSQNPTFYDDVAYYTEKNNFIGNQIVGGFFGSIINAFDINTQSLKWSKSFEGMDFRHSAPCIVTRNGKMISGALQND